MVFSTHLLLWTRRAPRAEIQSDSAMASLLQSICPAWRAQRVPSLSTATKRLVAYADVASWSLLLARAQIHTLSQKLSLPMLKVRARMPPLRVCAERRNHRQTTAWCLRSYPLLSSYDAFDAMMR